MPESPSSSKSSLIIPFLILLDHCGALLKDVLIPATHVLPLDLQDASKSSPTGVRFKANSSFPLVAAAMATSSSSNALKFLGQSQQ